MRPYCLVIVLLLFSGVDARAQGAGVETFERAHYELDAGRAWQAQGLFERAIREGYPRASGYRALAEAFLALDHRLFDARSSLERSLAADSTDVATWYRLAEVNLQLGGMDAENRARRALREVLRLDPTYENAFDRWSRLYLDREDAERVREILQAHLERSYRPEIALRKIDVLYDIGAYEEAMLDLEAFQQRGGPSGGVVGSGWLHHMAVTEAALGRDVEGWGHYMRGIQLAASTADLEPYFADLEPLLTADDRAGWPDWSLSKRRDYLVGWWNRRDPLPLTEENERWVEQQRRIRFARATFQYRKPMDFDRLTSYETADLVRPAFRTRVEGRAMDDRAEIYLRHGPPDLKAGVGKDECGYWYYRREGLPESDSFAINFRRTFFGNDCVFSPYPTTAMGRGHFTPSTVGPWDTPRINDETEAHLGVALASDSYPFEIAERIPLDAVPVNFSYRPPATELSLYFSIPIQSVAEGEDEARYRKGLVVYDRNWKEITRQTEEMSYVLDPRRIEDAPGTDFLIDLFRLRIPPGEYHFAIQVDDRHGEGIGVWKEDVAVRAFAPDRFELSDVVLAGDVQAQGLPRFTRYGHAVLPLPSRTLLRGQPFFLYYEIYDLTAGPDGRSRFRVEYAIRSEKLDRSLVGRLFDGLAGIAGSREEREEADAVVVAFDREERVQGRTRPEVLSFDTRQLPAGTYWVEVKVIDRLAGDAVMNQDVEFTIVD